ncbi:WD40 repeat-containing protein HOS15-like [Bidens hawaiensis]|uniref:WD40 repeat-containing protein HOS15-like n=1 Tax=Bidens hawaiensis TaxID=980011 RepID=UPI00404B52F9
MATITDSQLNYMVFRCLQESGFQQSALIFGYEAGIDNETIDASSVPPGALISFLQKGIEMEANLKTFSTLNSFTVPDEAEPVNAEKRIIRAAKELENTDTDNINYKLKETFLDTSFHDTSFHDMSFHYTSFHGMSFHNTSFHGHESTYMPNSSTHQPHGVRSIDVLRLEGHYAEVLDCAWSPAGLVLASGSRDSTARIWSIADRTNSTSLINRVASVRVLQHFKAKPNEETSAINTLDWNTDGRLLSTGSQDGSTRIWDIYGGRNFSLIKHTGLIYSISWSKKDEYLLIGAYDRTAIIWDTNTYVLKQQFEFHSGPVMDVDWQTNRTFVSGSTDKMIYVCKIGENQPVKRFSGHKKFMILQQSLNFSMKSIVEMGPDLYGVWSMEQDMPVHDFKDHDKAVYTVKWSPTGPTTNNPNKQLLLASGSHDSTVKLWDVESGGLYHSLNGHRDEVLRLSLSPDGEYLATGSGDKRVNIWSVKDGKIVKTYFGKGTISQVSWSREGYKIAYSTSRNNVYVSDFRM